MHPGPKKGGPKQHRPKAIYRAIAFSVLNGDADLSLDGLGYFRRFTDPRRTGYFLCDDLSVISFDEAEVY